MHVAVSGRLVFIGHPYRDIVYVFRASRDAKSFKLYHKLKCPNAIQTLHCESSNMFGACISADCMYRSSPHKCRILVGAPGASMFKEYRSSDCVGGAFLFESDDGGRNWACTRMFAPEFPVRKSHFGLSVSLYNTRILIGAPGATIRSCSTCVTRTGGVFATTDYSVEPHHRRTPLLLSSRLDEYAAKEGRKSCFGSNVAVSSDFVVVSYAHRVYVTCAQFSVLSVFCVGDNNIIRSVCIENARVVVGAVGVRLQRCSSSFQGCV